MSSIVYTSFKGKLFDASGAIDMANDTFNVVLLNNTYPSTNVSAETNHTSYYDVSAYEIPGTGGYTVSAGKTLTTLGSYTSGFNAVWSAANVTWTTATITARYATIYDATRSNALVCTIDFGSDKSSSNGDFTIQWNAAGILNLTD